MAVRVLADGKIKFTICTTAPVNPAAPTVAELAAGIDMSCKILDEDFTWSAVDSDTVAEKALCDTGNSESFGPSNFDAAFTLWRYYATGGGIDVSADAGFAAVKTKGATLYGYARRTDKASTAAWAATDEIYLGAEFTNDNPQIPGDKSGWLKWRIPCKVQRGWTWIAAAT